MPWLSLVKYILPPILIIGLAIGIYYKGRSVERKTHVQEQLRVTIERLKADQDVVAVGEKIKRKVEVVKKAPPSKAKDDAYSCLFSNAPLEGKCDSFLQQQ